MSARAVHWEPQFGVFGLRLWLHKWNLAVFDNTLLAHRVLLGYWECWWPVSTASAGLATGVDKPGISVKAFCLASVFNSPTPKHHAT